MSPAAANASVDKKGAAALQRPAARGALAEDPELEALLREGAAAHEQGRLEEAHGLFRRAHARRSSDFRCQAWYGLTLILVEKNSNLGVRLCEEGTRGAGAEAPLSWLNLARAFLALGYRERAVRALQKGLSLDSAHPGLLDEIEKLGVRRRPVLGFLSRSNPVNRLLGRLRSRLSGR